MVSRSKDRVALAKPNQRSYVEQLGHRIPLFFLDLLLFLLKNHQFVEVKDLPRKSFRFIKYKYQVIL
ncbi:MAG: hypothetical protein COB67_04415 [SAR324 cluster bacterium]|uniref:Uncharacterized protein n=1 Tax=SAR324 cluster bacterium TaxID=2024889 RepID=A0A2A4T6P1_9DELT|nr:MAG: hypothetical protein COB67_04415 [SAR324 cluster bacterium]